MRDQQLLGRAKRLRTEQTPAEIRLWHYLRAHRFENWKFRRQTVIGSFIVDFSCRAARLVIEIDGDTHAGRSTQDARRTAIIENEGWCVIRFRNADVMGNLEGVLDRISAALQSPLPTLSPEGERALLTS